MPTSNKPTLSRISLSDKYKNLVETVAKLRGQIAANYYLCSNGRDPRNQRPPQTVSEASIRRLADIGGVRFAGGGQTEARGAKE